MARTSEDSSNMAHGNSEPNLVGALLALANIVMLMNHADKLLAKLGPSLPTADFASAGKVAGWCAFAAVLFCRPVRLNHWLRILASISLIDLAGFSFIAVFAIVLGMTGLIPDLDPAVVVISEPRYAVAALLSLFTLLPFIGGLAKAGLLPGFRWPEVSSACTEGSSEFGWLPPRFRNFMALVTVAALVAGYVPLFQVWISENWPGSPLSLIHREFAVLPLPFAAILAVGTGLLAPDGHRVWPMTALVALLGALTVAVFMVLLAFSTPLWAWRSASESTLTAIVTGLPALALIPLARAAWRAQRQGDEPLEGDGE